MTETIVAKGIQIPASVKRRKRTAVYPWNEIEIGDSFLLRIATTNMWSYIYHANKRYNPKEFRARLVDGGRVRCWG